MWLWARENLTVLGLFLVLFKQLGSDDDDDDNDEEDESSSDRELLELAEISRGARSRMAVLFRRTIDEVLRDIELFLSFDGAKPRVARYLDRMRFPCSLATNARELSSSFLAWEYLQRLPSSVILNDDDSPGWEAIFLVLLQVIAVVARHSTAHSTHNNCYMY
jgi:hypothetical protein